MPAANVIVLRGLSATGASPSSVAVVAAMAERLRVLASRFGSAFAMGDIPELFLSRADRLDFDVARNRLLFDLGFSAAVRAADRKSFATARADGLAPTLLVGTLGDALAATDRLLAAHAARTRKAPGGGSGWLWVVGGLLVGAAVLSGAGGGGRRR